MMKKLLSFTLTFLMILSLLVAPAISGAQKVLYGDADGDGAVTVLDVTAIQRHLIQMSSLKEADLQAAMVSGDKTLSIIDATWIQRYLAGIIQAFPIEASDNAEMTMTINGTPVKVEWENNAAVTALREAVKNQPLTIRMSMYGGFEQVGSLGMTLPHSDTRITTSPGDVILYSGNQMVVFYGSNTWSYTRLGRITDQTENQLKTLLSGSNVTIVLSI